MANGRHETSRSWLRAAKRDNKITAAFAGLSREKMSNTKQPQNPLPLLQEIRGYLLAAADGSMSRNNSERLASELLSQVDGYIDSANNVSTKHNKAASADDMRVYNDIAANYRAGCAETLAAYAGLSPHGEREWHSVGTWLHPGESIAALRQSSAGPINTIDDQAASERAAKHDTAEFPSVIAAKKVAVGQLGYYRNMMARKTNKGAAITKPLTDEQRRALVSRIVGFDPIGIITAERIVVETERAHGIGSNKTNGPGCDTYQTNTGDYTVCKTCGDAWPAGTGTACEREAARQERIKAQTSRTSAQNKES